MENNIFITYVVPCYNIENQLPRCIKSLEMQHVGGCNVEFILVNDGSTDGTLALIQQFAERNKHVIVIDQLNQGVCAARNNALKIARGEYVFFLDGDDYLADDASKQMYEACKDNKPDILLVNNYKVWEGEPNSFKMWVDYSRYVEEGTYNTIDFETKTKRIPISFKLYKLSFLRRHGIEFNSTLRVGEVYTFFIHALVVSNTVGVSYAPVMYYLKRKGESATTSVNVKRDISILETLHTLLGYVDKYNSELRDRRAFLAPLFFMVTAFYLIKYVGRVDYTVQIGELMKTVRQDKEYQKLLCYFTGKGVAIDENSLLAFVIRFLPVKTVYSIIRKYYKYATRNIIER